MERSQVIKKMQSRVDMCRQLAQSTTDQLTAKALNQIADEGEADIKRLQTESD